MWVRCAALEVPRLTDQPLATVEQLLNIPAIIVLFVTPDGNVLAL